MFAKSASSGFSAKGKKGVLRSRAQLEFIVTKLEPEHILYVFRDGFKSVSFELLYHDGIRANHVEDELRLELKMFATMATAMLVHDTIHFCLRIRSDEAALSHEMKTGHKEMRDGDVRSGKRKTVGEKGEVRNVRGGEKRRLVRIGSGSENSA